MFIHQQESVFISQEQSKHNPWITSINKNDLSNNNEQGIHSSFCKADKTQLTFGKEKNIFSFGRNMKKFFSIFLINSSIIIKQNICVIKNNATSKNDFLIGCKELSYHIFAFHKYVNLNSISGTLQLGVLFSLS